MTSLSNGVTRTDTVSDFFSMTTSASEASKSVGAVYRVEVTPNPASFFWDGFRPLEILRATTGRPLTMASRRISPRDFPASIASWETFLSALTGILVCAWAIGSVVRCRVMYTH